MIDKVPIVAEAMVYPSGLELRTASIPIMPPAPILFSTTNGCPNRAWSFSATIRVRTSEALPAVTNPSFAKAGLNFARPSKVVSGRR